VAATHVGSTTPVFGATSAAPTYPTGLRPNDDVFIFVGASIGTVTYPTISGWTKVFDAELGGGVAGAGTGTRRQAIYKKDAVAGTETGSVTVTPTGTVDVVGALMIALRAGAPGNYLEYVYTSGSDTAAGATASVTESVQDNETFPDVMFGFTCAPANTNMGSQTFTATGVTFGTAVEHQDAGSITGNDIRVSAISRPITAGTASAATVHTNSITTTLGCVFIRAIERVRAFHHAPQHWKWL
jgi:hypothetical protein